MVEKRKIKTNALQNSLKDVSNSHVKTRIIDTLVKFLEAGFGTPPTLCKDDDHKDKFILETK